MNKALEAGYIQTGLRTHVEAVTRGLEYKSKIYIEKTGFSKEVATGLYLYKIYRAQSISFPVGKGKRLTITPNQCIISLPWDWR